MAMRRSHEYQIECIIVGDRRNRGDFAVRAFNAKIVFDLYNRDQFDEIIEQPRTCESFTTWKQGWTTKEHRDMEWRETQDKLVERHHRQSLAIALVGAALGMFATIWATAHNQTPVVNVILSEQAKAVDAGNKPQP